MAATVGLFVSEPERNVHAVFSDGLAAENRQLHWTCRFVWSGEKPFLQPWGRGFVLVCAENLAVTPVVIVFAGLEAVEFLNKSFAEEWPESLLCASLPGGWYSVT
jgi:hypothetical protein